MILEQKRTSDHVVLPVFYDIDPTHVRKQTGSVAKALARHGKKQSPEKMHRWRKALKEVADLAGMVLQNQNDGHESKFIKKIVDMLVEKLCRIPLGVDPHLVGIQYWVESINSWLQDGSSDVGILGIYGIGGIGKTTIARVVYNSSFKKFEGSSFLENIRETSEQYNGLVRIQKQLLYDLSNRREVKIHMVAEGINRIKDVIGSKKVLLVLDDVDHRDQLQAIFSMRNCFFPGRKIIITTRRPGLLKLYKDVKECCIQTLDSGGSFELFCWHAFGQNHPIEGYFELSKRIVQHIGGLPLALKILGSSLTGQSLAVWVSQLQKLDTTPDTEILKKLRISYDALQDDHDKDIFLHIACFFIGKDKDVIIKILDGCGFYSLVGIQNLIDRCLITIDTSNKVKMPQMIRDMGRDIVRQENAKNPDKRSRLWHHKDSLNVLRANKQGSETIEGLSLQMHMYTADNAPRISNMEVLETDAFTRMHKLQILQLFDVQLNGSYEDFPKELRWLCWLQFPLHSIPSDFILKRLVVLEMQNSSLRRVWKGTKHLPSLKILDLSHSSDLTETGDFLLVPNLERLFLEDCRSLIDVDKSIGKLEKLVYLNMKNCTKIGKLPEDIYSLKSLETFILSGCSNLYEFPMEMRNMASLKVLEADEIPINRLLATTEDQVKSWPMLKHIDNFWASFPSSLLELSLANCNLSDDAFPMELSNLSSLKRLYFTGNPICSLPDCIRGLEELDYLGFSGCTSLKGLEGLPRVSRELLTVGCISLERITFQSIWCLPKSIVTLGTKSKIVEIGYWFKLVPIERVGMEMINILGLSNLRSMEPVLMSIPEWHSSNYKMLPVQGLYEYGIFSTFFHGNKNEVPGQFSHRMEGSSSTISSTVHIPLLPNLKIRGLNIFTVYTNSRNYSLAGALVTEINNKSKGLKWVYQPSCYGIPNDDEDMIWLSHWKLGNQLEAGDEVTVSVVMGARYNLFKVKEWGFHIVQESEDILRITSQPTTTSTDFSDPGVSDTVHEAEEEIMISNQPSRSTDLSYACVNEVVGLSEAYQVEPGTYWFCGGPMEVNRELFLCWSSLSKMQEHSYSTVVIGLFKIILLEARETARESSIINNCVVVTRAAISFLLPFLCLSIFTSIFLLSVYMFS
uniref:TMV resistance protein N-like n=1 Tax=Fragaria vesca subsp. vesca TaxID=101020 RepID=UPI0005CA129D|nr:PREDICTED: TMV resistance protein N-like [Fragaria vesca subsp. vesca]